MIKCWFVKIPFIGKFITISHAGIVTFFISQNDIKRYRHEPEMGNFVKKKTIDSFEYIGVWLSDGENLNKFQKTVEEMLNESSAEIYLYFRNPIMCDNDKKWFEDYYSESNVCDKIKQCINEWKEFRTNIKEKDSQRSKRIHIFIHSCNITCSLFLFNIKHSSNIARQRIFFDQKLYGFEKSEAFSMEIKYKETRNSLFHKLLYVGDEIKKSATEIL